VVQTVAEVKDPAAERQREIKPEEKPKTDIPSGAQRAVAQTSQTVIVPSAAPTQAAVKEDAKPNALAPETKTVASKDSSPLEVGSLIAYATAQAQPVYPHAAKSFRAAGIVKVEITVNESGEVAEVQNTSGPSMLHAAAQDAVRKWKFKPFTRDGHPVRATGFVSFNFRL
jgi:protein TonB